MLNYDINLSFYSTSKYSIYSIQRSKYSTSLLSNHYPDKAISFINAHWEMMDDVLLGTVEDIIMENNLDNLRSSPKLRLLDMKNQSLEYFLNFKYPISIYPEDAGGYTVMIPDLSGCMTQGETLEEVVINIEEARQLWIETIYLSNKKEIPRPSRKI